MDFEILIKVLNKQLYEIQYQPLNVVETLVLQGIWQDRTYREIAQEHSYSEGYLTNVVAPSLYRQLTQLAGQRITKRNCLTLLDAYINTQLQTNEELRQYAVTRDRIAGAEALVSYPSGAIPPNSPLYIDRDPVENQIYEEIQRPGALVRIKAPREMGKTSLLLRVLNYANQHGYNSVHLDLQQVDSETLSDLPRFLRWLCASVSYKLNLEPKLNDYWDEDVGSKVSCTFYWRNYLLERIQDPLVLAFDEVNQILEHPQVAKDFFSLLRFWYEEAKRVPLWQKLRQIVVHSTEIYVPLQLHQSPFNVGLPIQLHYFSLAQVQELARRYGLNWKNSKEAEQLMAMLNGHPALVHMAIYHLSRGEITLTELLKTAPAASGIYAHHLQRHWVALQNDPKLATALARVMHASEPVMLDPSQTHRLSSMGLVEYREDKVMPTCRLYQLWAISTIPLEANDRLKHQSE